MESWLNIEQRVRQDWQVVGEHLSLEEREMSDHHRIRIQKIDMFEVGWWWFHGFCLSERTRKRPLI
ncbi:hypothetical protein ZOSMA_44G01390 [Zostera marina]|uniref:Uncharacterized protein n=1 Tax=Zostera marina TaxID=29655 RepID=A0A0K9P106_ZOSMR|nr:hypothetical protein ZOSMA_44G01390 [Zostera marina]